MRAPFVAGDFELFQGERVKDPEWDGPRLVLKRKLKAWGDEAAARILAAGGPELKVQTSLHRPYKPNRYRVDNQRVLLTATGRQKQALGALLGEAFKEDVASGVVQMTLSLTVDREGVEIALRVHPGAWWDGLAWGKTLEAEPGRLAGLLAGLPEEFELATAPGGARLGCTGLGVEALGRFLAGYRPAEQWISVSRRHPREGLLEGVEDQEPLLLGDLEALAPLYSLLRERSLA